MTHSPTVFDVEVWIDWDFIWSSGFLEEFEASYSPPSTHKTPLAIAAHHTEWWLKARKSWTFGPLTARVCSIAWGDLQDEDVIVEAGEDEAQVLETFARALKSPRVLTGYNVRRFDIPFLTTRASILGVELPRWWPHARDYRLIADIMDVTGGGRLDQWLVRCGLPAKTGDGASVEFMSLDEIRDYNRNDVHVERLLARRFAPNMPGLRTPQLPQIGMNLVPSNRPSNEAL